MGSCSPRRGRSICGEVDIRAENLGRKSRIDLGLVGDVAATIDALLPLLEDKADRTFLERACEHYANNRHSLDELATGTAGRPPVHPQHVARVVSDLADDDAIFTCDVGQPTVWGGALP